MTPGVFVRITAGPYAGMTGTIVRWWDAGMYANPDRTGKHIDTCYVVTLTASGVQRVFLEDEIEPEQRTSEEPL